jgi:hypothetical protein
LRLSNHLIISADRAASVGLRVGLIVEVELINRTRVAVGTGVFVEARVALGPDVRDTVIVGDGNCDQVGIDSTCVGWAVGTDTRVGSTCPVPHPDNIRHVIKTKIAVLLIDLL